MSSKFKTHVSLREFYRILFFNRQQSQAANVEALATVHNKLQEVLSTSINSLIQIRKNLRTEFIAGKVRHKSRNFLGGFNELVWRCVGIKTIKFPPKPAASKPANAPIVLNDDDDVIFINPTSTASQTQGLNVSTICTRGQYGQPAVWFSFLSIINFVISNKSLTGKESAIYVLHKLFVGYFPWKFC